jgi:polyadenylation factor subunit 2
MLLFYHYLCDTNQNDTYKFERVISTHQDAVRAMAWSKNSKIIISGDQSGIIKYFSPQITFVKSISDAHFGSVRGLSYAPMETKYVSVG